MSKDDIHDDKVLRDMTRLDLESEDVKQVFDHYGRECTCCGCGIPKLLTIEYMRSKGVENQNIIDQSKLYKYLVTENFPAAYETLCINCNYGKGKGTACPHSELDPILHELLRNTNRLINKVLLLHDIFN